MNVVDMRNHIRNEKRKLIRRIEAIVSPLFWESGYRTGGIGSSRPLLLFTFDKPKFFSPSVGHLLGFSEKGAMTDAWGGGLCTRKLSTYPLEDLVTIYGKLLALQEVQAKEAV